MDELWRPSKKLTKAQQELQKAQEWLKGCNLKPAPSTLVLTGNAMPWCAPETPQNLQGTQELSPMKMGKGELPGKGAPWGLETPSQLGSRASPKKQVGSDEEPDESGEGSEEGGLSQGEDEADETDKDVDSEAVTPCVTATRCGMQVAEMDQQEFPLMGGNGGAKGPFERQWKFK